MSAKLRQQFVSKLLDVFGNSEYPHNHDIFVSRPAAEFIDMHLAFENKKWDEVSPEKVIEFRDYLGIFSVAGLKYFFPSYLLTLLRFPVEADTLIDGIRYFFSEDDRQEKMASLKIELNEREKQFILDFLLNYQYLFSEDEFELLPRGVAELNRAIEAWQEADSN